MIIIRPFVVDADAALVSSNIPETDYPEWLVGTTYALGVRVIRSSNHLVYESLTAGNIGNTPETSPTVWLQVGKTNRWRMFDQSVTSQSTAAESINVTVQAAGRIDSIGLFNVAGSSVQVIVHDTFGVEVYNKTYSLVDASGVYDLYSYFYEPVVRKTDLVVLDLPQRSNPRITIIINDAGATAKLGVFVLGYQREIGGTKYGAKVGIQDYSVKTRDNFGNYSILERDFNKNGSFQVDVDKHLVDATYALLASYRSTAVVYIGSDIYGSTVIYGFFKDFSSIISYPKFSIYSIDIEGLT